MYLFLPLQFCYSWEEVFKALAVNTNKLKIDCSIRNNWIEADEKAKLYICIIQNCLVIKAQLLNKLLLLQKMSQPVMDWEPCPGTWWLWHINKQVSKQPGLSIPARSNHWILTSSDTFVLCIGGTTGVHHPSLTPGFQKTIAAGIILKLVYKEKLHQVVRSLIYTTKK